MKTTNLSKIFTAVVALTIALISFSSCGSVRNSIYDDPKYLEYVRQMENAEKPQLEVTSAVLPEKILVEISKSNLELSDKKDLVKEVEETRPDLHISNLKGYTVDSVKVSSKTSYDKNTNTEHTKISFSAKTKKIFKRFNQELIFNASLTGRTGNFGGAGGYGQEILISETSPVNIYWNAVLNYELGEVNGFTFDQYGGIIRAGLLFFNDKSFNLRIGGLAGGNVTQDMTYHEEFGVGDKRLSFFWGGDINLQKRLSKKDKSKKGSWWVTASVGYNFSRFKVSNVYDPTVDEIPPITKNDNNTGSMRYTLGLTYKFGK